MEFRSTFFKKRGKPYLEKNLSEQELNLHMASTPGFEPGPCGSLGMVGSECSHYCPTLAPFFLHDLTAHHLSNREGLGEFETVVQTRDEVEGLHYCRDFPNPSSVYIRICKHRKKVFYRFLPVRTLVHEACTRNQSALFCRKDALQNTGFSRLKCQLKRKKLTLHVSKNFPSFSRRGNG